MRGMGSDPKKRTESIENQQRDASLRNALSLINGERCDQYGAPEDSFKIIGEFWEVYDKYRRKLKPGPESPKDVALKMALLKIARTLGQEDTPDNYDDAAGYIGIAGDLVREVKCQS